MRILVLGGTGFLSRAVVDGALARGHDVVALTRGGGPDLPGVVTVRGDRDDVGSLRDAVGSTGPHDGVVDCSGYRVAGARAAAEVLGDVPAYAYVSSISAYAGWPPGPVPDEAAPTFTSEDDLDEYGPMKAESERVLTEVLGERLLAARAGLIVGPGDRTRRLTTWLHRVATQDRVPVPDALGQPIAVVDARDLAAWLLESVEDGAAGAVNATGPVGMTTFGGLLETCRVAVDATGGSAGELVPVPERDLLAAGVQPWTDLPFWMPADVARTAWQVGTERARGLGLASRPVEVTVADTWAWVQESGLDHPAQPESLGAVLSARSG